ncbi:MAG: adapter protein MecA 1/2 [Clostridiales bacterium]|nr:adapter protein MecA 1/2 [Clostridiales bacterium]
MKIEKISDTQIRCTLSKNDLLERELRISELAYGSEKAKELFRDMMQQAAYQFGFEADDIPLMIEAIPVSTESLVLIITKIEDPDELDTRFSKFSPEQETSEFSTEEDDVAYADEILNSFKQIDEILGSDENSSLNSVTINLDPHNNEDNEQVEPKYSATQTNLTKFYSFVNLNEISRLSEHIVSSYHGINSIYKDPLHGKYYLVISKSQHTPEEFNKICNIISEYGKAERTTYASYSYFEEHFEVIIKDKAIQILGTM